MQFSLTIRRSFVSPIRKYAAASSMVKVYFSQMGTCIVFILPPFAQDKKRGLTLLPTLYLRTLLLPSYNALLLGVCRAHTAVSHAFRVIGIGNSIRDENGLYKAAASLYGQYFVLVTVVGDLGKYVPLII